MVTKSKQTALSPLKLAVPLLTRAASFLGLCVILSGVLGPHIIGNGLVGRDGFQVYGGAGKALLFGALALLLLVTRKKSAAVRLKPWHWTQLIWLLPAAFAASTAWYGVDELIARQPGAWPLLTHACLLASVVFAAGATFGPANLRLLARTYRKEVLISLGLAIAFFGFLYAVYGLWKVLATIVLHSVRWLLGLLGLQSTIIMPRTLLFNKFGIDVAQYCSGIESIALFTSLYVLVGVLDWPRFNHRRFVAIFVPALAVLFGFNILRVAGLIAAGYYINPQIAFTLFHTYAGMVFFILYSIIFWSLGYKWMLRKN